MCFTGTISVVALDVNLPMPSLDQGMSPAVRRSEGPVFEKAMIVTANSSPHSPQSGLDS